MCPDIVFNDNVLGSARFSNEEEIKKARLSLNRGGFVFGRIRNYLVEKPSDEEGHILIVGAPGTGKSSCIAIPTLSRWKGSAFVIDIKGELSGKTAGIRKRNGEVYIFDPEDPFCSKYNPISLCDSVDGAQDFARSLIPMPNSGDPFWAQSAQAVLAAASYQACLKGEKLTLMIERICTTPVVKLVEEFQSSEHKAVRLLSSILVDTPEKTLGGVMTELKTKLLQFGADEYIDNATSGSDWTPQTLEKGASIYIRISEKMISQYEGLWTVIISQITRYLMGRAEGKEPPVLLMLDEFPRLGKVPKILEALSTLRSRNVHIALFIQSMAQLDHTYSSNERKIIADNCKYKMVFSASDPETQKYFSDLGGFKTVWSGSKSEGEGSSTAGSPLGSSSWNNGKALAQSGVPLIRPEEFSKLDYPVIFGRNMHPFKVIKAFYMTDPIIAPLFGVKGKGSVSETPLKVQKVKRKYVFLRKFIKVSIIVFMLSAILSYVAFPFVVKGFIEDRTMPKEETVKYLNAISDLIESKFEFEQFKHVISLEPMYIGGIYIAIVLFFAFGLYIYAIILIAIFYILRAFFRL